MSGDRCFLMEVTNIQYTGYFKIILEPRPGGWGQNETWIDAKGIANMQLHESPLEFK